MADSQSQALIATQYLTGTKPNDPNWSFFDETKLTEGSKRSLVKARRVRGDDNVYPVHPIIMLMLTTFNGCANNFFKIEKVLARMLL